MRSQFIQDQHFGLKNRRQDLQFGGGDQGVIGFLDTLEQLAVVAEKAANTLFENQGLEDADRQVRLPDAHVSGEQKSTPFGGHWVSGDEIARHHIGSRQRLIRLPVVGFIAVEGAVLVSSWDRGPFEQAGPLAAAAGIRTAGRSAPRQAGQSEIGRNLHR